jgi:hypothetical protein
MLLLAACTATTRLGGPDPDPTHDSDPASDSDPTEHLGPDTAEVPEPTYDHLPVLVIDSDGPIADSVKTPGTMSVIEDHDGTLEDLDTAPRSWEGPIGIEIHGSSSTGYPKLGYELECRDEAGEDTDCALAGMPAGSDWVLHAPYSDKSYVRNALAYQLGREVAGDARWEPRTRFVEVILDGDYVGIYLLVERVSREPDRLDIPTTTLPDGSVAGGFIVKVDQHRSAGFDTAVGTPLDWSTPKSGAVTAEEAAYLTDWFDQMEAVLGGDGFADPATGYAAWLDVDAWVDHFLVNEIAHNIDAYRLSAYLWTDGPPGHLLRAGPLWDFDRAWGNCNYCAAYTAETWIYDSLDQCGYAYQFPFWWQRLRQDPTFEARLSARWKELRAGALSDAAIAADIEAFHEELAEAEPRDQARWRTMGTYVDPNYYVGTTWEDELDWLASWQAARSAWMDAQLE